MRLFLSMDGGGVMSLTTLVLLRRIEDRFPGFLKQVDLFGGVSAGGMNALLMANHDNPADGLADAFALWGGDAPIYAQSLGRELGAVVGARAVYDNANLRDFLTSRLGRQRLKDLKHRAVAMTVQLDATLPDGRQAWRPKLLDGDAALDPEDEDVLAVDVGLRTGAFPMTFPIHQGYIDGGVVANNPALCVLLHDMKVARLTAHEALAQTRLLSIGTGMGAPAILGRDLDWGYGDWMFKHGYAGLFTDLVISAPMELVSEQCSQLLGDEGFCRLNPWPETLVRPSRVMNTSRASTGHSIGALRDRALSLGETADLEPTFRWIEQSGCLDSAGPAVTARPRSAGKAKAAGTAPARGARGGTAGAGPSGEGAH